MPLPDSIAGFDTQTVVALGGRLLGSLVVAVIAIVLFRSLARALTTLGAQRGLDPQMVQVLRMILKWAFILLTAAVIAGVLNIRVENLWIAISTGVAMVAIGFVAVWSFLSNVLAALIVMLWQPIRIGQRVRLLPEDWAGVVQEINLFFTVLRTDDGGVMRVPNSLVLQRALVVESGGPAR